VTNQHNELCTIMAVGDTSPPSENPEKLFTFVKDFMAQADFRFCQTERIFSTGGTYQLQGIAPHVRRDPKCAKAYQLRMFITKRWKSDILMSG
jgi:cell division ATPase FtsA